MELSELIDDFDGIQPPHVAFYSEAIRFNVDCASRSIMFVASFVEKFYEANGSVKDTAIDQNLVLDHLQNFLVHTAAVSKFFWPVKDGGNKLHKKRSLKLRKLFKISDHSVLKNRTLRNQLEHFDENLDKHLWTKPIVGNILPSYVGYMPVDEQLPYHLFRAFFVDTAVFETLGVQYELDPILEEIGKLYAHFYPAQVRT
tara:strand:- start:3444 stop:4043 length:600 start_codon:yes stop_codon:yes gene_type:complete